MGDAAGELDHLKPALDVALGVGDDLAVLAGQQFGQFVHVRLDQAFEVEHDPGATLGIGAGPALESVLGRLYGAIDLAGRGQLDPRLNRPRIGIEHLAEPARRARENGTVDEMVDVAHERSCLFYLAQP